MIESIWQVLGSARYTVGQKVKGHDDNFIAEIEFNEAMTGRFTAFHDYATYVVYYVNGGYTILPANYFAEEYVVSKVEA